MTFAIACALAVCICRYLLTRKNSPEPAAPILKKGGILPLIAGVCNVALNLFTILLAATTLSPSLIYPTIGIGGILLSSLLSVIFLRERLAVRQWIGIAVGMAGILLLSL